MECSKAFARLLLAIVLLTAAAQAPALTTEMQKAVRAGTFEVVLRKKESDALKYEKSLPLELIPFVIRSDSYWSVGTAFALSSDTYVSAAHVFSTVVNSQFGAPALRDSAGHVYPIDRILKWSSDEDYVVFSVSGAPPAQPLPASTDRKIDDAVFAVGNALGEGIVMRDGLLTSETPEQQDGRWKWLRFSAAASPGNSGGPLLDAAGRVIGIVRAKSPNENLNYGVPIDLVLKAGPHATFDSRYTIRLPTARASEVATIKTQFDLPLTWADFSRKFRDTLNGTMHRDIERMQTSFSDAPFPKGNATKMLAVVYDSPLPGFVQQNTNDEWDVIAAADVQNQDLPGRGLISTGTSLGVSVFRLRRPQGATDANFYRDPTAVMDLVLRGIKLTRPVGDQAIRILSLGQPAETSSFTDQFGRRWTATIWPLGYVDSQVISYWLPTPEGVVGLAQIVPSWGLDGAREFLKLYADALYANVAGTLAQWQVFLAHPELCPSAFGRLKLDFDEHQNLRYGSARLNLQLTGDVMKLTSASELELRMAYAMDGRRLAWDVGGVYLYTDPDRRTSVGVERHVKPRDDASKELLDVWTQMHERGPGFNGVAGHDEEYRHYWVHNAVSAPFPAKPDIDPQATVLYDVYYSTERSSFPMDLEDSEQRLLRSTHILER